LPNQQQSWLRIGEFAALVTSDYDLGDLPGTFELFSLLSAGKNTDYANRKHNADKLFHELPPIKKLINLRRLYGRQSEMLPGYFLKRKISEN
jgi:hypothetical protein